ncbi:hypothetical protein THIOSC13_220056 [uncultured Thiomicrorhabdus sp.]
MPFEEENDTKNGGFLNDTFGQNLKQYIHWKMLFDRVKQYLEPCKLEFTSKHYTRQLNLP